MLGNYEFNPFVDEELDYDEEMEDISIEPSAADRTQEEDISKDQEEEEEEEEEDDGKYLKVTIINTDYF